MRGTRSRLTVVALGLSLAALLAGCGSTAEPQSISDDERQELVNEIQQESWVDNAVCTIEVFRQEADITYGWAECTNAATESAGQVEQSAAYPFKIQSGSVTVPEDGSRYAEDIRKIFPEDLIPTIEQYSGASSSSPAS